MNWLNHHLTTVAVIVLAVVLSVYSIESIIEHHDAAAADKYALILKEQEKQTTILLTELKEREAQWSEQNQQQRDLIAKLTSTIAQRKTELDQTKKENSTLSAEQAAVKLSNQSGAGAEQVKAVDNTVVLDLPIAIRVIDTFDTLTTVQANYNDLQQQFESEKTIAANLQADVDQQKAVIASQTKQLDDQKNAYESQIAAEKAKARKGKLKWAIVGAVSLQIARTLLGF